LHVNYKKKDISSSISCCVQSNYAWNCSGHRDGVYQLFECSPRVTCPNHPDAILVGDYRASIMICPECGLVIATEEMYPEEVGLISTSQQK
jgi:hypothetical protein